jgi:hypothetical protein
MWRAEQLCEGRVATTTITCTFTALFTCNLRDHDVDDDRFDSNKARGDPSVHNGTGPASPLSSNACSERNRRQPVPLVAYTLQLAGS